MPTRYNDYHDNYVITVDFRHTLDLAIGGVSPSKTGSDALTLARLRMTLRNHLCKFLRARRSVGHDKFGVIIIPCSGYKPNLSCVASLPVRCHSLVLFALLITEVFVRISIIAV